MGLGAVNGYFFEEDSFLEDESFFEELNPPFGSQASNSRVPARIAAATRKSPPV